MTLVTNQITVFLRLKRFDKKGKVNKPKYL